MDSMGILWLLLFSFSYLSNVSAGKHEKMVQSAMLVGSVYCDTCFHQEFSETSHFISGASVAIECQEEGVYPSFEKEVKTNKHGEFKVQLPFRVGKQEKIIKRCMVKLVSSSKPSCAVASQATSSSFHLKSTKHGIHVFSAGFFTFKPINQPKLCYQEASSDSTSKSSFMKNNVPDGSYPSPANKSRAQKLTSTQVSKPSQSQPGSFLFPPIFPSPPPFGLPLPPNPFQPPPLLPPLPFVPSPPPFINIPPLPFFTPPPPPPFFNLPPLPHLPPLPSIPPLPFLTPPPPPPPSPPPPFLPIPPIRFPPLPPIFPGIPPASPSKNAVP